MVQLSKLMPTGVFVASIACSMIIFYVTSVQSKENKKVHIEQMTSELINFVIFIWVGKIMINISLFLQDPLSILAYPSDSHAFYIAVLCSSVSLLIKSKKGTIQVVSLMKSFIHVLIVGSFLYEFIHIVWIRNGDPIGYFILITILVILFFLLHERLHWKQLFPTIGFGWSFGVLLLHLIQPFVIVFGYMIAPWFICLLLIVNLFIILRKRDYIGWN